MATNFLTQLSTDKNADQRALKLLVISSDTFPPTRVDVVVLFGQELSGRGHQVDWILQSEAACTKAYVAPWSSGRVWVGPTDLGTSLIQRVRKHVLGIMHDMKLFSLLRNGDYDLIEIKDKFISGVFAAIAAQFFRKRFVYWLSWPYPEEYLLRARDGTARYPFLYQIRGKAFKFLLYRVILRAADHVFVQSEQMRRDIAAEGIRLSKMTAVPMGVRIGASPVLSEVKEHLVIPAGERCFLYLGTLTKVRHLDFLIRVLAVVLKEVPDIKLYLVGRGDDPSDEQVLIDEAKKLNVLSAVVMVGQVPQEEAFRYVQDADVCVSPFYPSPILNSTSPTKLVEYMAMGKAVVANDHPEQRLVIEESGGGYCVPWDEHAFAKAIVQLIRAPETAREMGRRGHRYVRENRSYQKIADTVELQLRRVVSGT